MSTFKKKGKSSEVESPREGSEVVTPEPEPSEDWSRVELATLAPPKAPPAKGYIGCPCGAHLPIGREESYVEALQRHHSQVRHDS
jgi:hypothetical protein